MKVTYILGAGVSMDFKVDPSVRNIHFEYPSGTQLIKLIKNYISDNYQHFSGEKTKKRIFLSGLKMNDIDSFSQIFMTQYFDSFDKFLTKYPEYGEIGKFILADIFIDLENKIELLGFEDSLYYFLFNLIVTDDPIIDLKNTSFITYNYDLVLERCLYQVLLDNRKTATEIKEFFNQLEILHIHGSIMEGDISERMNYYSKIDETAQIRRISQNIKIIYEIDQAKDKNLQKARKLITESEVIIFLGFGYDDRNMKNIYFKENVLVNKPAILGSTYGLTNAEIARIKSKFFYPELKDYVLIDNDGVYKAIDYLRNNLHFQRSIRK